MQLPTIASSAVFERALAAARGTGEGDEFLPGLAAPLDSALAGRLDEIWDTVESTLRSAFRHGAEGMQDVVTRAIAKVEALIAEAGARADELRQAVLARLSVYLQRWIDGALGQVRATLSVGTMDVRLESVEVVHRVTLSGSLKASLQEACAFTAAGDMSVTAHYRALP